MTLSDAQVLLPQFKLAEALRPGAQGTVFRGLAQDGQAVVVKIVEGEWQERGQREIAALGLVDHPSVVRLIAHGSVPGGDRSMVFLATSYVEGTDLGRMLHAGPLTSAAVARVVSSLASGLNAIWAHRIVHRDIKPTNIVVRPDGHGVLLDLGLALCRMMSTLTAWGVPGTPGYMSPEQSRGARNLTVKSDVFALGVTAFEALLCSHPYGFNQEMIARGVDAPSVPKDVGCEETLSGLVERMLHPLAAYRPHPIEIVDELGLEVR